MTDVATRPVPQPPTIGQATAIEQARAVAEVQAAVVVAQQVPRDLRAAEADMLDSCGRLAMANRAFYEVPRKGGRAVTGPSVHIARELARIFGNLQYGVHELRRDDVAGESEIQAFAWDVEKNVRSTRTFVVPHARMARGERQKLTDLNDIYLSNQNIGARAVRECIFSILPTWFTEAAQDRCRKTLDEGEGVPLMTRVSNMISRFAAAGVRVDQLEDKIGKRQGAWSAGDVAQMTIAYTTITRDGVDKDELFPPEARASAAEITGQTEPATPDPEQRVEPTDHAREQQAAAEASWNTP